MKSSSRLWSYYSNVYDVLNQFYPYQEHLDLLCSLLAPKPGTLCLDAGCGTGNLAVKLNQAGSQVIGIDYSNEMITKARKKNERIKFEFADLDAQLSFVDNTFDGIVSNNVIAYLSNPKNALMEIYRVLKPGGTIVVATLRENWSPLTVYKEHLKRKGLLHTLKVIFPLAGLGVCNAQILKRIKKGIYRTYNEKTFFDLLEQVGFRDIKISFSYANQAIVAIGRR